MKLPTDIIQLIVATIATIVMAFIGFYTKSIDSRINKIEDNISSVESDISKIYEDVGYLRGRIDSLDRKKISYTICSIANLI